MNFDLPLGTLRFLHESTQTRAELHTTLHLRHTIESSTIIGSLPSPSLLRNYWIKSTGNLRLKIHLTSAPPIPSDEAYLIAADVCASELWQSLGLRASILSEQFTLEFGMGACLELRLDRNIDFDERREKFNRICYAVSPADMKPSERIPALNLKHISCFVHISEPIETKQPAPQDLLDGDDDWIFMEQTPFELHHQDPLSGFSNIDSIENLFQSQLDSNMTNDSYNTTDTELTLMDHIRQGEEQVNRTSGEPSSQMIQSILHYLFFGEFETSNDFLVQNDMLTGPLVDSIPSLFNIIYLKNLASRWMLMGVISRALTGSIVTQAASQQLRRKLESITDSSEAGITGVPGPPSRMEAIWARLWKHTTEKYAPTTPDDVLLKEEMEGFEPEPFLDFNDHPCNEASEGVWSNAFSRDEEDDNDGLFASEGLEEADVMELL